MISYPSDKLSIYGYVDIPSGDGPFPVVILLHGYVDPVNYKTKSADAQDAAAFAEAGYIVIHPDYRSYPHSDSGPNDFRVGFAIDVMNLIAEVKAQAGHAGLLQAANPNAVFLWGPSLGGAIALRVITVGADVQGAVLIAPMSGDEGRNFDLFFDKFTQAARGDKEVNAPEDAVYAISPINYLDRISVPVSIHYGEMDEIVPPAWSMELCTLLQDLGKSVECFSYPNMPHKFSGSQEDLLIQRSIEFFKRYTPSS